MSLIISSQVQCHNALGMSDFDLSLTIRYYCGVLAKYERNESCRHCNLEITESVRPVWQYCYERDKLLYTVYNLHVDTVLAWVLCTRERPAPELGARSDR